MRKVTYPHLGTFSLALEGLLAGLGLEVVPPPPITKKTINLGVLHAPEFACFPLKISLGNFIEALEAGANTIVMAGGTGPCRFGYYGVVQREILLDLGYDFEMIVVEPPQGQWQQALDKVRALCGNCSIAQGLQALHTFWRKTKALDCLHAESLAVRAREAEQGATSKAYKAGLSLLQAARTPGEVQKNLREALALLAEVPQDPDRDVLRVGLVGEVYMLLEPYANLQVEKLLGEMGVEVKRAVYLSDWIKEHVFLSSFYLPGGQPVKKAAAPYLAHFVGGHGRESLGETVLFAREGFDGVIHILPFTCTPEIVAQSILPEVSRREGIPYLSIPLDEQSGEAGFITRLEAFIDLLRQRRSREAARAVQG
ncbi:MAG TPA: CoA protein activase [Firmicutes bacterium]|nr:CoA protein activase [Bacillota bacterium]